MTENMGKWPSGHSKTETIRSSDGCGETSVPSTMVRGYDFYRPGGYLGNPGWKGYENKLYFSLNVDRAAALRHLLTGTAEAVP